MTTRPRLEPLPPHRGSGARLDATPFWLGSGAGCGLRLHLPGVAERHAAVLEREDGFWFVPVRGVRPAPRVNGAPAASELRLRAGDVIELLPGVAFRFATGEHLAVARTRRPSHRRSPVPWRDIRERLGGSGLLGAGGWIASALALLLALTAGAMLVHAIPDESGTRPLSDEDAEHFDALSLGAYEHVERGTALLEMGLADAALREFARAVNTLRSSRLQEHPAVRRNTAALEETVAAIYRSRRIRVPRRYARTRSRGAPTPTIRGAMPQVEFAIRFARVQRRFSARFGRQIVVTGHDHPEHLSLYGAGSALDLRVRDLSREQVGFAIAALRAEGIRVKDFSDDADLRAQVRSAHAAGLASRAGTGLHLHADRFPDRRDRWTVP